jgi:parallel beta-helix repeat protein
MKRIESLVKLAMALFVLGIGLSRPGMASGPTTGNVKVAVILVKFEDTQIDSNKEKYVEYMHSGNDAVRRFFEEGSYSQLHITGRTGAAFATTDVYATYEAPRNHFCDQTYWSYVLAPAALAELQVPTDYDKYVFAFDVPSSGPCFEWASYADFDGKNAFVWTSKFVKFAIHELGHTLGLRNSTTLDCGDDAIRWPLSSCPQFIPPGQEPTKLFEYEPWDSMGRGNDYFKQYNIFEKKKLGWVGDPKIRTVTTSGTYTIHRLQDAAPGTEVQGLKIPIGGTDNYWVEYRQPVAGQLDGASSLCQKTWGSAVHLETGGGSYLIDTVPGPGDPQPDCRSLLVDGKSFSDPDKLVTIKQTTSSALTATYKITFECSRKDPTLLIPVGSVPKGGSTTFQIQVRNNDSGPGCGTNIFRFSGRNLANGTLSFSPSLITLPPGQTGTVDMTVSAPETCQDPKVEIELVMEDTVDPTRVVRNSFEVQLECAVEDLKVDSTGEGEFAQVGSCPAPAVSVSLTPDVQLAERGSTQTFTAFVTNSLLGNATISLTLSVPSGWTANVSPPQLTLSQGQTGIATLEVTIPANAALDTYVVGLTAANVASPFQYSFATADVGVDDDGVVVPVPPVAGLPSVTLSPGALAGDAGVQVTYGVSVTNNGASATTFNLSASSGTLTTYVFPPSVALVPGQSGTATLTVTVPAGLGTGSYGATVTATDISNSSLTGSAQATYTVRNCHVARPEITFSPDSDQVLAGVPVQYTLTVMNWDPSDCPTTEFRLSSSVPAGWTAPLWPETLTLPPHNSASAYVTVTSPPEAGPGNYAVVVSATDAGDSSHTANGSAYYSIVPPPVTLRESVKNGNWSDPTVWSGSGVPTAGDYLTLRHFVTVDTMSAKSNSIQFAGGHLAFSRVADSKLTVYNGEIYVDDATGWLDMGTDTSPIPAGVRATLRMESNVSYRQILIKNLGSRFTARGATKTLWVSGVGGVASGATSLLASMPANGGGVLNASGRQSHSLPGAWTRTADYRLDTIVIPDDPPPDDGGGPGCTLPAGWKLGDAVAIDAERRTITGLACETSDAFRITLSAALASAHATPAKIVNVTRNVVIEAAGPNQAHILSYAYDDYDPRFDVDFVEFAGLGGNVDHAGVRVASQCYGCVGWKGANAVIRNSVIRDSFEGLALTGVAHTAFENNVIIGNQQTGVHVSSSQGNLFSSNYFLLNGIAWSSVGDDVRNTYVSNTVAFNTEGFRMLGTHVDTLAVSNQINDNGGVGLYVGSQGGASYFDNFSYANGTDVAHFWDSLTLFGGGIGYNRAGVARPATGKEFSANADLLKVNLRGVEIGPLNLVPATQWHDNGPNGDQWYVLSFNQNGESGTVRLMGAHVLTGAMTLDSALPLYAAFATKPSVKLGDGHAATVNSVVQSTAQSQLISIRRVRGSTTWTVEGSKSGVLGTFTGSVTNQGFPSASPQFYLTFTSGPTPADRDLVDFLVIGRSGDAGVPKKLIFEPSNGYRAGNKSILTVAAGATFTLRGISGAPSTMGCNPANCVNYTFRGRGQTNGVGGVAFDQAEIRNVDASGLQLSGTEPANFSAMKFDNIGNDGGTPAYVALSNVTSTKQFSNITFANTPGISPIKNVVVTGADTNLSWYFASFSGAAGGPAFETDPRGEIHWKGFGPAAPSSLQFTSCTRTGVSLKWIDNSIDETKFNIWPNQCVIIFGPCTPLAVVNTPNQGGTGGWVEGGFSMATPPGTQLTLKVKAENAFGDESAAATATCVVP